MRKIDLAKTASLMSSADYKERFLAEYAQLIGRLGRLQSMLRKWDKGKLDFKPSCPRSTYYLQEKAMIEYIAILEARAAIEGIDLQEGLKALYE